MKRFEEKTVLVTGASSGIGRQVAIRISEEGGRVVLIGRSEERLRETIGMMNNTDYHVAIPFDLYEFEKYSSILNCIKEKEIILDGMVHCAGETVVTPLRSMKRTDGLKMMDIHLFSFIEIVKLYMKKGVSNGGSVVAVSAINAHVPQKCMTMYAAAKVAVECACRTMAIELKDKGIRINSVVVGGINNRMKGADALEGVESEYSNPVGRQLLGLGNVEQIAEPILFLLSEESSFITGRELYADGGLF